MTIAIVGAGPSGLYSAYLLAKAGKKVEVIEEHKSIGQPVQCTGIVTSHLKDFVDVKKDFVINKISKVKVFSKTNFLELKLKNENYILDREKFDKHLAKLAADAGAKISLGETYIGNDQKRIFTNKRVFIYDYLIGADGPLSPVAKTNSMFPERKFWYGIQARIRLKKKSREKNKEKGKEKNEENAVEFYPNIGTYAWIVPESEGIARIGVCARTNAKGTFDNFLKAKGITKKNIINLQAGIIPEFSKNQIVQKGNIFLIGDAAGHVKATTGGGIIPGLIAARILTDCILKNKRYKNKIKGISREMKKHLRIRQILDRFEEKEWRYLLNMLNSKKTKAIIEEHDREYPSRFALKLLLKQPRLLYFLKYIV